MSAQFDMKIIFLQDFQGVETGGVFYTRGQVVDLSIDVALRLVNDKRAAPMEVPMEVPVYEQPAEQPAEQVATDDSEVFDNVYVAAKMKRGRK